MISRGRWTAKLFDFHPGSWKALSPVTRGRHLAGKAAARGSVFEPALDQQADLGSGRPEMSDEFTNGAAGLFEVALDVLTSALLPAAPDPLFGGHAPPRRVQLRRQVLAGCG